MSVNSKLRNLARLLPYYPRTDKAGKFVISFQYVMGSELLKKNPKATDKDGKAILENVRYRQPIVICEDHFSLLKSAYKENGEAGIKEYCNKIQTYAAKQKGAISETK